jgi:hypothetical protein
MDDKARRPPRNIDEYKKWLRTSQDAEITPRIVSYYNSVTSKIKQDLESSDFWTKLVEELREFDSEYLLKSGYPLLVVESPPDLLIKPFESFLLKTFRKNVLENRNWPTEPSGGWVLPGNWFSRVSDIVRTLFVVKYLDGVEFLVRKISSICEDCNLSSKAIYEAREEGYYAAHLYVRDRFEIPKFNWDTEVIQIAVEIQVTTQVQEVIRRLLHKYYENRRAMVGRDSMKWQWDYKSDEFVANYLGHILHYVEGMIMEIRDKGRS